MKRSDELRQEKAHKVDEMRALLDKAKAEKRGLSDEERSRLTGLKADVADLTEQIEAEDLIEREQLRVAAEEAKRRETADPRRVTRTASEEEKVSKAFRMLGPDGAINQALRGRLDGVVAEVHQEGTREARAAGVTPGGQLTLPSTLLGVSRKPKIYRDMLSETTTAGGFTVQTEIGDLIPFLDPRTVTRQLGATYLTGLTGNIDFPRNDAAASAAWEDEASAADETSPTFDRVQMSPERLAAFTDISKQVIAQSTLDMEAFVRERLNMAIAQALDTAAINGSGSSNQPTGILNTSGIGSVAGGTDGAGPTFANIIDLETEIAKDNADLGPMAYLTTPGVRGFLKQTEKAANTAQFIWTDVSLGDMASGPVGQMNGYRALVSTLVPSNLTKGAGTGLHAILFGYWRDLVIGQWAGVDLVVDPYSGAKNALVTLVINSWWDIAVRHAESFAAMKDADITAGI